MVDEIPNAIKNNAQNFNLKTKIINRKLNN